MTSMNYSRPSFVQQAMRAKHGGKPWVDPDPRPSKLDWALRGYEGDEPILIAARDKVLSGLGLTASENGKAGELIAFLARRERAEELVMRSTDTSEVIIRLRKQFLAGQELSRRDISDLQDHLKSHRHKL